MKQSEHRVRLRISCLPSFAPQSAHLCDDIASSILCAALQPRSHPATTILAYLDYETGSRLTSVGILRAPSTSAAYGRVPNACDGIFQKKKSRVEISRQ